MAYSRQDQNGIERTFSNMHITNKGKTILTNNSHPQYQQYPPPTTNPTHEQHQNQKTHPSSAKISDTRRATGVIELLTSRRTTNTYTKTYHQTTIDDTKPKPDRNRHTIPTTNIPSPVNKHHQKYPQEVTIFSQVFVPPFDLGKT